MYKKLLFFIVLSLVVTDVLANTKPKNLNQTICLNMIVKDEKRVIQNCLESVKGIIDYWVIVDTGSTDGTQDIIIDTLKDIPGKLYQSKWQNFEYNRNEALFYAKDKADYILFIDADEKLVFEKDFVLKDLDLDFYYVNVNTNHYDNYRILLIKSSLDWMWKGVLHEDILSTEAKKGALLKGVENIHSKHLGQRSLDPDKFLKDAKILEEALLKEPDNSRYVYYLAESYFQIKNYEKALFYYQKRALMQGWEVEEFWSLLQIARIYELFKSPADEIITSYTKAFEFMPTRSEPLFYLARYLQKIEDDFLRYLVLKEAIEISYPKGGNLINVEAWIYDYGALLEFADCCFILKRFDECYLATKELLSRENISEELKKNLENNLNFLKSTFRF